MVQPGRTTPMLRFALWNAPAPLSVHVSRLWRLRGDGGPADWLLPDVGGAEIAIHLRAPGRVRAAGGWFAQPRFVVGGLGRALALEHPADLDVVGIQLAPGCACLLRARPAALRDVTASLADVAPALDRKLEGWAGHARAGRAGLRELASIIAGQLDPGCDRAMAHAGAALAHAPADRIAQLAAGCGLSRRQFSRRFRASYGVTARAFIQLARFARACRLASAGPAPGWAGLAAAAGYVDQSHLVRDFQRLVGLPPTRVFGASWYAGVAPDGAYHAEDGPSIQYTPPGPR
jgi:AraC-like DNA-binding protein